MKRLVGIVLLFCMLLACCACSGAKLDTSSANKVVYGEKYIYVNAVRKPAEQQTYFIFYENGTLEYHVYGAATAYSKCSHYTITYRYEVMDEGTVAYFFDSIKIYEDDEETSLDDKNRMTDNSGILLVSENVLSTTGSAIYVRQSYFEEKLPNFAVTETASPRSKTSDG